MLAVTAQPGIFALGTPEHCYLELDLAPGAQPAALVAALAACTRGLTSTAGVNIVVGLRPELWEQVAPGEGPADARGWDRDLEGAGGYRMPATQHDAWVWVAGGDRTAVFDAARTLLAEVGRLATVGSEITGWLYRRDRDLTGFVDGTENPPLLEAPGVAAVPEGRLGAGSSVVLYQLWRHDTAAWEAIGEAAQERAMGRTKADSVELDEDVMPESSHVARTAFDRDGEEQEIFRRNVAYGGVTDHGTAFVGFAQDQWRMEEMLRRMAGASDGVRCALTHYLTAVSGAYYTCPTVEALAAVA